MSLNKVMLIGRLGQNPEMRYSQSQMAICTLNLATNRRAKDASGNWVDQTEWHRVVTFGSMAENCNKFLQKGRQVYVEGRMQTRKWQDKNGIDRYTTEVVAENVTFLGNKNDMHGGGYNDYGAESNNGPQEFQRDETVLSNLQSADSIAGGNNDGEADIPDDDIPF